MAGESEALLVKCRANTGQMAVKWKNRVKRESNHSQMRVKRPIPLSFSVYGADQNILPK